MNESARQWPAALPLRSLTGLILGTCALLLSPASFAAVYQCEDASGAISFTDQACPDKAAGSIVAVSRANIDYGYDRTATSKVRARARKDAIQFRNRWQAHNAQMEQIADAPDRRRIGQYQKLQAPIVKPTSKRKQETPYRVVTRGY